MSRNLVNRGRKKKMEKRKRHDEIINMLSKLLKGEVIETNYGGKKGIDLITEKNNFRRGIEVKTFPSEWTKKLLTYKKTQKLQKITLVLEIPEVVDEVFVLKKKELAIKAKNISEIIQKWITYWLKTVRSLIKEDLESSNENRKNDKGDFCEISKKI